MRERERAIHKAQLHRLLTAIADHPILPFHLAFKGGTCARMLGYIDRFSVDLDFDLFECISKKEAKAHFYELFEELDFSIKDESEEAVQFFLRYESSYDSRNTLKLEALDKNFQANEYKIEHLSKIDRSLKCQTPETIFGNKLVAFSERFESTGKIAARDLYDIQHLFMKGYDWNRGVIRERTGKAPRDHIERLRSLIEEQVTQRSIDQDLNVLLERTQFQKIRKRFRSDLLIVLKQMLEIEGA